ncbi:MAG: ISKra4 family transposase [Sciscionella sp.]
MRGPATGCGRGGAPGRDGGRKRGLYDQFQAEIAAEVEHLAIQAASTLSTSGDGFEAAELAIRTALLHLGSGLVEKLLSADTGYRGPRIDCGNGHHAEFVSYRVKQVDTVLGRVTLRRAYYHCRVCKNGVVPHDDELGMTGASLSPGLRKMTARAASAEPFATAAGLLAELAGVSLSTKRVERSAEADGGAAEQHIRAESAAIANRRVTVLPPARPPDTLYLAIDGTGVPMVPAATRGRAGKYPDGRARTREVTLACLFTQTRVDTKVRPVRDPDSASYLGTFAPADEFATLVHAEALRRGAEHTRQLVILGDGAHWIWNLATTVLPEATQIVDLYHAREHLHDLAKLLAPALGDQHAWLQARLDELDAGDIETLVHAAGQVPLTDPHHISERNTALGYFTTNTQRMRYTYFRELGMFVGSGAVEAGCKAVIGQRLKLSGMRWNIPGATGILTLRCHQASNRWDHIWTQPHNQTPHALTA